MARRPRSRTARAFPKTLTGILATIALAVLAVLAALGVKTDWFHGKPSAPPTERPTAARTAPPPGELPRTPSTFTAAKKALYDRVYADHRVTFYCGCAYGADPSFISPLAVSAPSMGTRMVYRVRRYAGSSATRPFGTICLMLKLKESNE